MSSRVTERRKRDKPASTSALSSALASDSCPPHKKQKLKPLMALSKAPVFRLSDTQPQPPTATAKGKERAQVYQRADAKTRSRECEDDRMWVDVYEPETETDLAIHPRKFKDVEQWLREALEGGPSGKLRKYRRILVLTGPAGTAKTATIKVLARKIGFDILEWRNSIDDRYARDDRDNGSLGDHNELDYEGLSEKFQSFLTRALNCSSVLSMEPLTLVPASRPASSQPPQHRDAPHSHRVILLEDLPNILHPPTRESFHSSLESILVEPLSSPVVIVISDAGLRGEDGSDGLSGAQRWKGRGVDVVDIRSVLPPSLLSSPYVTHIPFNPIAPTLMKRALQNMLAKHFAQTGQKGKHPSEILDIVIETSNGDIRSAIMALQFACTTSPDDKVSKQTKGKAKGGGLQQSRALLEVLSRREQNIFLFHLLGKILYNKRKGDVSSTSASAKDVQRDKELDLKLIDPPNLPPYLSYHERRASRVDVEALYADSPIDASLLSLYIHQNYTEYCDDLEDCDGIMDWLSWVDSSGGDSWLQANPHQFHLVTLGTLHSLPSPVPRRGQKPYKPAFFEAIKSTREAEDGLKDVQSWLQRVDGPQPSWTRKQIALEMGSVLKSRDSPGSPLTLRPPRSHWAFSRLEFAHGPSSSTDVVDDHDVGYQDINEHELTSSAGSQQGTAVLEQHPRGWLETDDIEEF